VTWQALLRHPSSFTNAKEVGKGPGINLMRSILVGAFLLVAGQAFADQPCKEQVDAAFAKLRDAKAFRLETTITNADGTLKMKADYVLPDRMHQVVTVTGQPIAMEMIVIGKRAWSNERGVWAELPTSFADTVANQLKETVAEPPKVATDYKCAGDKEFEGKTYTLYQGTLAMPLTAEAKDKGPRVSSLSVPNQQNVYIDKGTGLPVRNIVTPVTDPNKRLFDGTFTIVHDLSIEPPAVTAN
jgi:hypothetical protein